MKKRKSNAKNVFIFILLAGTVAYSYFHSSKIYSFYMRAYYEKIKGQNIGQLAQKGQEMYDKEEYLKLMDYLKNPVIAYPDSRELKILEALANIKLGKGDIGSDIILSTFEGEKIPKRILEESVRSLYRQKHYKDILMVLKKNNPGESRDLLYYYGISLAKTGDYKAAIPVLKRMIAGGGAGHEVYLNLGSAYNNTDNARDALPYLERAREMNRTDQETARSLSQAYRKLGRHRDAEKILLRMR